MKRLFETAPSIGFSDFDEIPDCLVNPAFFKTPHKCLSDKELSLNSENFAITIDFHKKIRGTAEL
jgi:hypothetical protein